MERLQEELDFINEQVSLGGKKEVLTFIADILFHSGNDFDKTETIRSLFANGYCYYFSKMLQDAFPGGKICLCYPYGHIAYIYDSVAYDIDGISSAETDMYIPIEELGEAINDFRHIEGKEYLTTKEEVISIGENWKKKNQLIDALHL